MTQDAVAAGSAEQFIPVRKGEIVESLLADPTYGPAERDSFRQFCRLIGSVFHYEHFEELEALKEAYHHFNPHHSGRAAADEAAYPALVDLLRRILGRANFVEVTGDELERAARERALFQVEVRAATDGYRDVLFFRRGRHRERISRREWLGFRTREVEIEVYDDVVMVATLRPEPHPEEQPARRRGRSRRHHRPGSMLIKCFRDIPSADLNTLLPDAKVIMGQRDKWMIGVPALFAGIPLLLKLGPTLAVLAILVGLRFGTQGQVEGNRLEQALFVTGGLLALGGFVTQQWVKYQRTALRYQLEINGNLYFRNVSNNAGMFDAIIGAAEEQEFKEAVLAYHFLLGAPATREELDARIEAWLASKFGVTVDFEVDDGLAKLERLGLLTSARDRLFVIPLGDALRRLDRHWDGFFQFDPPGQASVSGAGVNV
jgi:hypothetical protein